MECRRVSRFAQNGRVEVAAGIEENSDDDDCRNKFIRNGCSCENKNNTVDAEWISAVALWMDGSHIYYSFIWRLDESKKAYGYGRASHKYSSNASSPIRGEMKLGRLYSALLYSFVYCNTLYALHPIYSKLHRKSMPTNGRGEPLQVHVGFYVESLGNFRSTEMTFDMDLYLYMSWQDTRMRHNGSDYVLVNDKALLDQMWLPDLYFANARTAYFHEVTVHNFNMFVSPEGVIAYGTRVTLNLACHLNLQDYPLDRQSCSIKIISYAHVKQEMNATWFNDGPIRFNPEIALPEYHIMSFDNDYCNGVFHYTITPNSSRLGDFSCLLAMVNLKRAIGFHLVQSYIPTGLIVAISWVSFWIDRRAVPARVSLSFTTLLTLSTQGNGIRYALPPVSYAKAIDYFYGVCMLFIFGVLLEFAMVNSYMRRANKYNHMAEKIQSNYGQKHIIVPSDYDSEYEEGPAKYYPHINKNSAHLMYKALRYSRRALAIDKAARFAFPSVFMLFNVIYWMYYMREPEDQ